MKMRWNKIECCSARESERIKKFSIGERERERERERNRGNTAENRESRNF